jgi:CrcB protein
MLLPIAVGGALGSVTRYLLGTLLAGRTAGFPWATLAINVTGSLLLGFVFRLPVGPESSTTAARAAITVGFCGGYTTFSTFSYETLALIETGSYGRATLYALASVGLSVAAAVVGVALARGLRAGA